MTDEMTMTTEVAVEEKTGEVTKKRSWKERGMTTIEYALGLLCAAAVVLVVLRFLNGDQFFDAISQWIYGLIQHLIPMVK